MAHKGKKIVWHKKAGKLIPSKFAAKRGQPSGKKAAHSLVSQIRRAVEEAHKGEQV